MLMDGNVMCAAVDLCGLFVRWWNLCVNSKRELLRWPRAFAVYLETKIYRD